MHKRMTWDRYQELAQRTSPDDGHDRVDNAILGLIGETGELVDVYKKWKYQSGMNADLPAEQFAAEIGDVLWYLAELAEGMGRQMGDICRLTFTELDAKAQRICANRSLRSIVLGLSSRANRMRHVIDAGDWKNVNAQFRWILRGCACLACMMGRGMEEIARMNIRKLEKRYPDGFDAEISMRRYL